MLRDRGVRPVSCNTWLKALQAFTAWMHARGAIPAALRLKPLKVERRVIATLSRAEMGALVGARSKHFARLGVEHAGKIMR